MFISVPLLSLKGMNALFMHVYGVWCLWVLMFWFVLRLFFFT